MERRIVGLGNIVHEVLLGQSEPPQVRSFPAFLPVPAPAAWGKRLGGMAPHCAWRPPRSFGACGWRRACGGRTPARTLAVAQHS